MHGKVFCSPWSSSSLSYLKNSISKQASSILTPFLAFLQAQLNPHQLLLVELALFSLHAQFSFS